MTVLSTCENTTLSSCQSLRVSTPMATLATHRQCCVLITVLRVIIKILTNPDTRIGSRASVNDSSGRVSGVVQGISRQQRA